MHFEFPPDKLMFAASYRHVEDTVAPTFFATAFTTSFTLATLALSSPIVWNIHSCSAWLNLTAMRRNTFSASFCVSSAVEVVASSSLLTSTASSFLRKSIYMFLKEG